MVEATRLTDRYVLEERLATGGMGAVYTATDERLGRRVAVKLLKDDLAGDPRFVERFRREARAVAAISHPNIANVFDYGEDAGRHFIVMELVEGRDLSRVLREEGPLAPERASHIARQVCEALAHAHAGGVIHRDIKPANIIVGNGDGVKVTDFGIARATGDDRLTATGSVLGTVQYLSPEQASGEEVGPASDIYSLGIVLYEMLTGSVPFTADSPVAVAMRHVSEDVPHPSNLNPDVPPELDDVVARATARSPRDRFRDAQEMAAALGGAGPPPTAVMAGVAPTAALGATATATAPVTSARPDTAGTPAAWPVPADRWDPRKVGRTVLVLFVLLALLAAGLLLWRLSQQEQDEPQRRRAPAAEPEEPAETTPAEEEQAPQALVVPNVIGMPISEAESVIKDAGLEPQKQDVPSAEPKDTVVETNPPPDTEVAEGDTVVLYASTGEVAGEEGEEGEGNGNGEGQGKAKGEDKGKGKDKD